MYCHRCGLNNHDWMQVCRRCKARLKMQAPTEAALPPPVPRREGASSRETLIARSFRTFRDKVRSVSGHARERQRDWSSRLRGWFDVIVRWEVRHCPGIALAVGGALLGISVVWGLVRGDSAQGSLAAFLDGGVSLLLFAVPVMTFLVVAATFILLFSVFLLAKLSILLGLGIWMGFYALWRLAILMVSLLALIPLSVGVVSARGLELAKGIFYTCPSRKCAYRGLPVYVCPDCSEGNRDLWPNLYGLLWHECIRCGRRLPVLDVLGRRQLGRRCGGCEMPLLGRHAGRARERLVAIAGGPGSGKTNYLLMAVHEILVAGRNGHRPLLRGEIDDPRQEALFEEAWQKLEHGEPAAKTSEVMKAALLYGSVAGSRCQLYLYDAPGEEFASIGSMSRQQYFPLLEGLILLVDPAGFGSGRGAPLRDVVASTLAIAATGIPTRSDGRMRLRVAVVLSKADLVDVRAEIGDVRAGSIEGPRCREAIVRWGGEASLRAIEHRFESVEYFACSALGRTPSQQSDPFRAHGVIEPLAWVLTGERIVCTLFPESLNNRASEVSIELRPGASRKI
jgi:hypothetical protein